MTEFDDKLKDALSQDDQAFLRDLENGRGLFTQLGGTFQGPMAVWSGIVFAATFVMFGLCLYGVWGMFNADTTKGLMLWAALAWFGMSSVGLLKQWLFERMNTLSILRELKLIELRLVRLEDR